MDTPVIVLHGLGERIWPLNFFMMFLQLSGFHNVIPIHWPANHCHLELCLDELDDRISRYVKRTEPIFVVGNSMGGVMALQLHRRGWNVTHAISVAAPLKGSLLFQMLELYLPKSIFNILYQPGYAYLRETHEFPEIPHSYTTVSFGPSCDGLVYQHEASLDLSRHVHFFIGTHFSLALDPRVWMFVGKTLAIKTLGI